MLPFLRLPEQSSLPLRDQICEVVSSTIARGILGTGHPLPSCRDLAVQLGVSRNTVHEAYLRLIDLGLIEARNRSGYVVRTSEVAAPAAPSLQAAEPAAIPLLAQPPSSLGHVKHPRDWADYPFPFVYNQTDPSLFPVGAWRECSRRAQSLKTLREWTSDAVDGDSPRLIEQLRQRLLLQRGIIAAPEEIMVTLGSQSAITMLGLLFRGAEGVVAVEEPGFPEARNAFAITGNALAAVPVDADGLVPDAIPRGTKLVYTTPSHQFPTSVALSARRREQLVALAEEQGFFICEDDYEPALSPARAKLPTLKSLDRSGRVIYLSSFSKTLSPGLRLGFLVASGAVRREAAAIRRIIMRHVPTLIQETAAIFLALGQYESHVRRHETRQRNKWHEMRRAIDQHLGTFDVRCSDGGSSFWLTGPPGFDSGSLSAALLARGVIIDRGELFHFKGGERSFRLGFASMDIKAIAPGIALIAATLREMTAFASVHR